MSEYFANPARSTGSGAGTVGDPFRVSEIDSGFLVPGDVVTLLNNPPAEPVALSFSGLDGITIRRDPTGSGLAQLTQYQRVTESWSLLAGDLWETDTTQAPSAYGGTSDFADLHVFGLTGSGDDRLYRSVLTRVADQATCFSTPNSWYWTSAKIGVNLDGADPNDLDIDVTVDDQVGGSDPILSLTNCDGWLFENVLFSRPVDGGATNLIECLNTTAGMSLDFRSCHLIDPAFDQSSSSVVNGYCLKIQTVGQAIDGVRFDSDCMLQGRGLYVQAAGGGTLNDVGSGFALARNVMRQKYEGGPAYTSAEEMWFYQSDGANNTTVLRNAVIRGLASNLSYGFNVRGLTRPSYANRLKRTSYPFRLENCRVDGQASSWADYAMWFRYTPYLMEFSDELAGSISGHDNGADGQAVFEYCDVLLTPNGNGHGANIGASGGSDGRMILLHSTLHFEGGGSDHAIEIDAVTDGQGLNIGRLEAYYSVFSGVSGDNIVELDNGAEGTVKADHVVIVDCMFLSDLADAAALHALNTGTGGYVGADVTLEDPTAGDFTPATGSAILSETLAARPATAADGINRLPWGDNYGAWQDGASAFPLGVTPLDADDVMGTDELSTDGVIPNPVARLPLRRHALPEDVR